LDNIGYTIEETKSSIDRLHLNDHEQKVINWLSPPNPSTNYNKAIRQRHDGSGFWFLRSNSFTRWKTQTNTFLWLHGIPGCGKTILSSAIIEDLGKATSHSQSLLYFYFDFNDTNKQSVDSVVRSLISQLYYKRKDTQKQLDSLFSSCEDGRRQPTTESLCTSLLHMIQQADEVWIVLDALDECSNREGSRTEGFLSWAKDLLSAQLGNVHLLVTSRREEDIESAISEWARTEDMITIKSDLVTNDIRAYVRTRVREDNGLKRWRSQPEIQEEIETRLMEKADGM
jgi:hypothetical protein